MGPLGHAMVDKVMECTEDALSVCSSLEKRGGSFKDLPEGVVEERIRVDREKLESMITGYTPADPCDMELLKLPTDPDGKIMTADNFFQKIMDETNVEIKYPKFLKVGARNKKDPHVRILGQYDDVQRAAAVVRSELEPHNKVTMKLDISWTHHSHIIGKGGNTIRPVVRKTGVNVHFPDSNKNSESSKSNQVSINCRGEELAGLEEARGAIRDLTPIIFTFKFSTAPQFITLPDPNFLVMQVQKSYNVQVDLKVQDCGTRSVVGSVRGCESDVLRVKEATLFVIHAYSGNLASQMPVQMTLEILQHHAFIFGRNNETVQRIMKRTSTKITLPDPNDPTVPPLKKSTVTISGAIDNVYLARQNIIGCLPLVLMFDLMPETTYDPNEVSQVMQALDVHIVVKNRKLDGRRPVIIKGAEKNAGNIYEAWNMITKSERIPPKARIPPTYHIMDTPPTYNLNLNITNWLNSGSSSHSTSISPLPSSHPTPLPSPLPSRLPSPTIPCTLTQLTTHPVGGLWGGTAAAPLQNQMVRPVQFHDHVSYTNLLSDLNNICSGTVTTSNNTVFSKFGPSNLNSLLNGLNVGDNSLNNSSNSGSSLCSSTPSPRDASPDQLVITPSSSSNSSPPSVPYNADCDSSCTSVNGISAILSELQDRRAPGCEKKQLELVGQSLSISDYNTKKVMAAKAMKEPVSNNPRIPTSSWSGYGFSKSMPGFMIKEKMHEQGLKSNNQMPSSCQMYNLSASNLVDAVLPKRRKFYSQMPMSGQPTDLPSLLVDVQLGQYIDVFTSQDVDLNTFLALDDKDLKELGIMMFGHRKRMLMLIKNLTAEKPQFGHSSDCSRTIAETPLVWD
ncbi:protein bicaudal C isoform X2 [Oratosquilla oratoria]|uniref:protein bicaudal C isoform X2 n=1 Tax=Oratosquilla oratoria TaxID=337810 RepID=UPI003F77335E